MYIFIYAYALTHLELTNPPQLNRLVEADKCSNQAIM